MTSHLLKLYRLKSESAGYGDLSTAVVYAFSPEDALEALAEAFTNSDLQAPDTGYLGSPANPYEVMEEVPFQRGLVLGEGQEG